MSRFFLLLVSLINMAVFSLSGHADIDARPASHREIALVREWASTYGSSWLDDTAYPIEDRKTLAAFLTDERINDIYFGYHPDTAQGLLEDNSFDDLLHPFSSSDLLFGIYLRLGYEQFRAVTTQIVHRRPPSVDRSATEHALGVLTERFRVFEQQRSPVH